MVKVKIVGAGGYGGVGAIEILSRHTEAKLTALVDIADTGRRISQFRHEPSGRSLSGNYDSRPNRQSPSALRRGHIWR